MSKSQYHHGSVRQDLVAAALEALKTEPYDAISLRKISRSIGISATAAYRHFESKSDLMCELAATGRAMLAQHLAQRSDRLAHLGKAYLGFATGNPNLFGLMCQSAAPFSSGKSDAISRQCMQLVPGNPGDPATATLVVGFEAWALAHGLARLVLEGQIDIAAAEKVLDGYAERNTGGTQRNSDLGAANKWRSVGNYAAKDDKVPTHLQRRIS